MSLEPIFIKATTLNDAWHRTLYQCVEKGREFVIDQGSFAGQKRLEFDYITVHITQPWVEPLLPKVNPLLGFPDPVAEGYLDEYLPYLMTGEDKPGEAYTYGQRMCKVNVLGFLCDTRKELRIDLTKKNNVKGVELYEHQDLGLVNAFLSQIELMTWTYKNKGYRNNQMILQVGQPSDMLLKDPPCLRHIDTRIQDGKLHFFPYFRSWDLFGGFSANLAAIELMRQYCAAEIGLDSIEGEIIAASKGCHLYDHVWKIAEAIRGRKMEEFR